MNKISSDSKVINFFFQRCTCPQFSDLCQVELPVSLRSNQIDVM